MNILKKEIKRSTYIGLLLLSILGACHKDKNIYDYADREVITVEGLAPSYEVATGIDVLKISIKVESNLSDADFEYRWVVYPTNSSGTADTLSRTKDLDYPVKLTAQGYKLINIVTNKRTKLSKYTDVALSVTTPYTRGWYVLKDDGANSDLDQFLTIGSIVPNGRKIEDVYSSVNNSKIAGTGTRLTFLNDYKAKVVSSSPTNTRTLMVGTTKDISAIYINDFKKFKDGNSIFFAKPELLKDMVLFTGQTAQYLFNNGRLHGIVSNTPNSGTFGGYIMRDSKNSSYSLSPYFLTALRSSPYFFDNENSSFVQSVMASPVMSALTDKVGTQLSATNNNKRLLYMSHQLDVYDGVRRIELPKGWAIFEDKTTAERTVAFLEPDQTSFDMKVFPVAPQSKLYNSSKYSILVNAESLLYFCYNNKDVYSYGLNSGVERLQFAVPAGEEVAFIRHRSYTAENSYAFDYVMIGTNSGGNYKIRMFEKESGDLKSQPVFTLEGKGSARDVIYISPSLLSSSFPTGY